MTALRFAPKAAGLLSGAGRVAATAADGAVLGAAYGAGQTADDMTRSALFGAGGGVVGKGIGKGIGKGLRGAGRWTGSFLKKPNQQAADFLKRKAGLHMGKVSDYAKHVAELGNEGMVIDALGSKGGRLGRAVANQSPEAEHILKQALYGRREGQAGRVVDSLEDAARLPRASERGLDDLKRAAYDNKRGAINRAYAEAREAGADMPLKPFSDLMTRPMFKKAFGGAKESLQNMGQGTGSRPKYNNLSLLDQAKRGLDDVSGAAYRAGKKDKGGQASALAILLRNRIDKVLATVDSPAYAKARGLRQRAYQTEQGFEYWRSLGKA